MSEKRLYQKKPLLVEAYRTEEEVEIETPMGVKKAEVGDYIFTNDDGETFVCSPEVFHESFESLEGLEKCACEDEVPKMGFYVADPEIPVMFQELHEIMFHDSGRLLVVFEMGSITLDISNPKNWLEINRTYVKIYNDDTEETTIIRMEKVTGLIYEPLMELHPEDVEDV